MVNARSLGRCLLFASLIQDACQNRENDEVGTCWCVAVGRGVGACMWCAPAACTSAALKAPPPGAWHMARPMPSPARQTCPTRKLPGRLSGLISTAKIKGKCRVEVPHLPLTEPSCSGGQCTAAWQQLTLKHRLVLTDGVKSAPRPHWRLRLSARPRRPNAGLQPQGADFCFSSLAL